MYGKGAKVPTQPKGRKKLRVLGKWTLVAHEISRSLSQEGGQVLLQS